MTTDRAETLSLYRAMARIRRFEELIVEVYPRQEMRTPVHLSIGQEAIAAGVCAHLAPEDYLTTTHRNHAHCLAKGADPAALYAELCGRLDGCCRGRGGSMHPVFPAVGILGTSAIVGGGIPFGTGLALAARLRGESRISAVFFGDGASEEGAFHESLNFAALKRLPVLYVCENNLYATVSPLSARQPSPDIHKRAKALGVPAVLADGNDVLAVHRAAGRAVAAVRAGEGPRFLELRTYRWMGHVGVEEDHLRGGRPKAELDRWKRRCPIARLRKRLVASGEDPRALDALAAAIDAELRAALEKALRSPFPDPGDLSLHLYQE